MRNNLKVSQLKLVLRALGLNMTGKKSDQQDRILLHLQESLNSYNSSAIEKVQRAVWGVVSPGEANGSVPTYEMTVNSIRSENSTKPSPSFGASEAKVQPKVSFAESPFYRITRQMSSPSIIRRPYKTDRMNISMTFTLNTEEIEGLKEGTQALYILSTKYDDLTQYRKSLVEFPSHTEIQVNYEFVPVSTKTPKNKPAGAVKPPDISQYILKKIRSYGTGSGQTVVMSINVVKEEHDYLLNVYLVELIPISNLLEEVQKREKISKLAVIETIQAENNVDDDDLVATASRVSLKDPVSFMRMKIPARATSCTHLECFDLETYFDLQKQGPSWVCPLCNKQIAYTNIAVNEYMEEIIESTAALGVDEVEIEPNGTWSIPSDQMKRKDETDSDEEDDRATKKLHTELQQQITEIIDLDSEGTDEEPASQGNAPQNSGNGDGGDNSANPDGGIRVNANLENTAGNNSGAANGNAENLNQSHLLEAARLWNDSSLFIPDLASANSNTVESNQSLGQLHGLLPTTEESHNGTGTSNGHENGDQSQHTAENDQQESSEQPLDFPANPADSGSSEPSSTTTSAYYEKLLNNPLSSTPEVRSRLDAVAASGTPRNASRSSRYLYDNILALFGENHDPSSQTRQQSSPSLFTRSASDPISNTTGEPVDPLLAGQQVPTPPSSIASPVFPTANGPIMSSNFRPPPNAITARYSSLGHLDSANREAPIPPPHRDLTRIRASRTNSPARSQPETEHRPRGRETEVIDLTLSDEE